MFKVRCIEKDRGYLQYNKVYTVMREDGEFYYLKEFIKEKGGNGGFFK